MNMTKIRMIFCILLIFTCFFLCKQIDKAEIQYARITSIEQPKYDEDKFGVIQIQLTSQRNSGDFSGIVYGVYDIDGKLLYQLDIDADGTAEQSLPSGKYQVKMIKTNDHYQFDDYLFGLVIVFEESPVTVKPTLKPVI